MDSEQIKAEKFIDLARDNKFNVEEIRALDNFLGTLGYKSKYWCCIYYIREKGEGQYYGANKRDLILMETAYGFNPVSHAIYLKNDTPDLFLVPNVDKKLLKQIKRLILNPFIMMRSGLPWGKRRLNLAKRVKEESSQQGIEEVLRKLIYRS